ncbi:hypothetical protein D3C86_1527040 [compost metagenome]
MSGLGQCRDGTLGDVFCIDKGLGDLADGECEFTLHNGFKKVCLAEVLAKPAGPQNRPVNPAVLYDTFGLFRFNFAAPG